MSQPAFPFPVGTRIVRNLKTSVSSGGSVPSGFTGKITHLPDLDGDYLVTWDQDPDDGRRDDRYVHHILIDQAEPLPDLADPRALTAWLDD